MDKKVNLPSVVSSLLLSVAWSVYNHPVIPPTVPTDDIDK